VGQLVRADPDTVDLDGRRDRHPHPGVERAVDRYMLFRWYSTYSLASAGIRSTSDVFMAQIWMWWKRMGRMRLRNRIAISSHVCGGCSKLSMARSSSRLNLAFTASVASAIGRPQA